MSSLSRNFSRVIPRNLRLNSTRIPPFSLRPAACYYPIPMAASISSLGPLKSSAPIAVARAREYDPEIKDMASYVHNFKIDSDLAVSFIPSKYTALLCVLTEYLLPSLTLLDSSSSIRSGAVLKLFGSRNVRNCLGLWSKGQLCLTAQGYQEHLLYWIQSTVHSILVP